MSKRKIIISTLCMVSLLALPLQASADYCTHPRVVKILESDHYPSHHGYDYNYYQHHEWVQNVEYVCLSCGEELLGDKEYLGDWEDHDWDIDWDNPDDRGWGLVAYEACCRDCDLHETLYNP